MPKICIINHVVRLCIICCICGEDMEKEISNKILKLCTCHSDEEIDQDITNKQKTNYESFIGMRDMPFSQLQKLDGPFRGYHVRAVIKTRVANFITYLHSEHQVNCHLTSH